MATPQDIERAAQEAAKELVSSGKFNHSSNEIKMACSQFCNGMTKEERDQVRGIVTDRLKEAQDIVKALPAVKAARDNAIGNQNVQINMEKEFLKELKDFNKQKAAAVFSPVLDQRINENREAIGMVAEQQAELGHQINQLDQQMKDLTQAAMGAAIKGDPTDKSVQVNKRVADNAANHAAEGPKESKSLMQRLRSKLS